MRSGWVVRTDRSDSFAIAVFLEFTLMYRCEVLVSRDFVSVLCADAKETLGADSGRKGQIEAGVKRSRLWRSDPAI